MSSHRNIVLKIYKQLHRTRMRVFEGDARALTAARTKINEEFKKNKHVVEEVAIKTVIQLGEDVERELRTQVIQAREVRPGVFEAKITQDTVMLDNIPFKNSVLVETGTSVQRPCCQNEAQHK